MVSVFDQIDRRFKAKTRTIDLECVDCGSPGETVVPRAVKYSDETEPRCYFCWQAHYFGIRC